LEIICCEHVGIVNLHIVISIPEKLILGSDKMHVLKTLHLQLNVHIAGKHKS
jgi:hypothetical protein